jgi:hypothetical protein
LRIEGVTLSRQRFPTAVKLGFIDRRRYFLEMIPQLLSEIISENMVAYGIEPGTSGSVARNSDH